MTAALIVIAKAPEPGRSKTRLCPPCTPQEAAALAEAALLDTVDAVDAVPATGRRVLVLDGGPVARLRPGWEVIPQRGRGLDERLANAFADVGGPALLVGMDTPQVTPVLLAHALETLLAPDVGAVLGPAPDGDYWSIGLRRPDRAVFVGVPMSTARTGAAQRRRLRALGLRRRDLPALRDVDTFADALEVAAASPGTRFAAAMASLGRARAGVAS